MEWAMPSDDRDRQLEKALARHLRSDAIDAACPDAETLAAYHEHTLSLEEMAQWKQHIAACARCQETLNLLEEPNVVQGSEEENRKMMELVGGRFAAAAVSHVAINEAVPAAMLVSRGSAVTPMPKRAASLRWVVPVGALAAGLLVWVGVRETQQNKAMKSSQIEVAQNRPSTASAPMATAPAPKTSLPEEYQRAETRSQSLDELRRQDRALSATQPAVAPNKKAAVGGAAGGAAPVLNIPAQDKEKRARDAMQLKDLSASPIALEPPAAPEVNNYTVQNRELPPTQTLQPSPAGARGVTANEAANTGRMLGQQNQVAKSPAQKSENFEITAATNSALAQSMSDVLPAGGTIIVAPNDAYSWRVGSNGKIEHSTDNSRTWMPQKSGVTTDLTAGSATSGKVCWVVGKVGTVLLTTDRGKHWKQLASPTKDDLGGVNAVDDKRASIWTTSHRKSFETNDAGATWSASGEK
jgi:Photosynthesis system II assembly factor YCF48